MPITMGWVLRQDNDPDGARASFEAALRVSRRSGYLFDLAIIFPERRIQLPRAADTAGSRLVHPSPPQAGAGLTGAARA